MQRDRKTRQGGGTAMNYRSLFSGCGGGDIGFDRAGMVCRGHCEIEPECITVLKRHWPDVPIYKDITAFAKLLKHYLKTKNYAAIERLRTHVISGGSPCQDLSVAGQRAGLDGERSGLFRDMVRVVRILRPKFIVWENVPGVLSSNGGKDFAAVIGYFTGIIPDVPAEGWGGAGFFKSVSGMWNVAFRVLDSQFFGVPQRRRRVFLIGSLGDGSCCEILFEPDSLSGDFAPRRKAGEAIAGTLTCGTTNGGPNDKDARRGMYISEIANAEVVGCLSPGAHPGGLNGQDAYNGQIIIQNPTTAPTVTSKFAKGAGGPAGDETENKVLAFVPRGSEVVASLSTRPYADNDGQEDKLIVHDSVPAMVANGDAPSGPASCVRRLTPRECERLQDFPDDHTRYREDGTELSDSARYRMIGNAWTSSVAEWIGRRLIKYGKVD